MLGDHLPCANLIIIIASGPGPSCSLACMTVSDLLQRVHVYNHPSFRALLLRTNMQGGCVATLACDFRNWGPDSRPTQSFTLHVYRLGTDRELQSVPCHPRAWYKSSLLPTLVQSVKGVHRTCMLWWQLMVIAASIRGKLTLWRTSSHCSVPGKNNVDVCTTNERLFDSALRARTPACRSTRNCRETTNT